MSSNPIDHRLIVEEFNRKVASATKPGDRVCRTHGIIEYPDGTITPSSEEFGGAMPEFLTDYVDFQLRENATVFGDRLRPLLLEILLAELTLGFRIPYIHEIARYL